MTQPDNKLLKSRLMLLGACTLLVATLAGAFCTHSIVRSLRTPRAAPLTGIEWVRAENAPSLAPGSKLIVFGATWCPDCVRFAPEMERLYETWSPRGVSVFALALETPEKLLQGLSRIPGDTRFPIGAATPRIHGAYNGRFNETNIPVAYLINKKDRILWHGDPAEAEAFLNAHLSEFVTTP